MYAYGPSGLAPVVYRDWVAGQNFALHPGERGSVIMARDSAGGLLFRRANADWGRHGEPWRGIGQGGRFGQAGQPWLDGPSSTT